ncbi:E3 ubiquitin-protein ligase dbl4-like [Cucumis melo var. makuwa]|nr:E3 ubiquitin-protein ligase RSL1-like [Cucumis melo]KAA0035309.1 E3 ubiquitin-protein ligase dbl4-like [Cucumis melo var. makuwa]TYK14327.1 E3 ubiquitin-protein ligase dbl4-like [Cucumis melo var. makuwa]
MASGATNIDSDLDDDELAYDLQMEEVIAASLNFLPSTSHSPPPSTSSRPSPFPDDDSENHDAIMLLDDDASVGDDGLEHRLNDLVAEDFINVSDDEWGGYDWMSYRTSMSALKLCNPLFDPDSSRLYFKGLVNEESVRDETVTVVAVFDPRENLMMEVKRPLETVRERGAISPVVAELMALIEGLEAALVFPLKRVSFFCDDRALYRYITGRLRPKLREVERLVDQVGLLRGYFSYCEPFLVEPNDVKYAFSLANGFPAIETGDSRKFVENCKICYEDRELDQMFTIDGCLHRYCFSCMRKHVEVKFLGGSVAKCPHEGCESIVRVESCDKLLPPNVIEIIQQRLKESSIPFSDKVYCPQPRCSALMSKTEVLEYTKEIYKNAKQSGTRKCVKCHQLFCIKCKASWHVNMTCEAYKKSSHNTQTADAKLKILAREKLWRTCARCSHLVELSEGCYHIICRCGYEFCYTCGAEWKNKQPTCSCPIWDEENIINDEL